MTLSMTCDPLFLEFKQYICYQMVVFRRPWLRHKIEVLVSSEHRTEQRHRLQSSSKALLNGKRKNRCHKRKSGGFWPGNTEALCSKGNLWVIRANDRKSLGSLYWWG
jgi:hypothetical protein